MAPLQAKLSREMALAEITPAIAERLQKDGLIR